MVLLVGSIHQEMVELLWKHSSHMKLDTPWWLLILLSPSDSPRVLGIHAVMIQLQLAHQDLHWTML